MDRQTVYPDGTREAVAGISAMDDGLVTRQVWGYGIPRGGCRLAV